MQINCGVQVTQYVTVFLFLKTVTQIRKVVGIKQQ